jgi:hypothetical protein
MIGQMVRAGSSQPMKVIGVTDGIAKCILVDSNGIIRRRFHHIDQLSPLWLSLQPRSLWPETTHIDILAIDQEERAAAASKKERQRLAKKSKRSNKIKRARVPA